MDTAEKERWMGLALEEARRVVPLDEVPVGAILVADGLVIGKGGNHRETTHRTVAHAEIMALEAYNKTAGAWRLPPGTTLFVTAEPCMMCTGALIWARLDHLVYGCQDPRNAGLRTQLPALEAGVFDHKFKSITAGTLGDTCGQLMKDFFAAKRGQPTSPEYPLLQNPDLESEI